MEKKDTIELEGIILASLGNKSFRAKARLKDSEKIVIVTIASNLRRKIVEGDRVLLAISIYNPAEGWIVKRL